MSSSKGDSFPSKEHLRKELLRLNNEGLSTREIAIRLNVSQATAQRACVYLKQKGHKLKDNSKSHTDKERARWSNIIKIIREELLPWSAERDIPVTGRSVFYKVYSKGLVYNTASQYRGLIKWTAAARRGREQIILVRKINGITTRETSWRTWTGERLPIDCFVDETRLALGYYNDDPPEPPEDPD